MSSGNFKEGYYPMWGVGRIYKYQHYALCLSLFIPTIILRVNN